MIHLKILLIYVKALLHLPIYRIDVLNWAEYLYVGSCDGGLDYCGGLCDPLYSSCRNLNLDICNYTELQIYFPKYSRKYAKKFNEHYLPPDRAFWWTAGTWDLNGRLGFFYWLKDQYKYDRTNLRNINI